jgi:hypothetical protein
MKEGRNRAPTRVEAAEFNEQLHVHNKKQRGERDQYADHIDKSRNGPDVYISVAQDEIDHAKSSLPIVNAQTSG